MNIFAIVWMKSFYLGLLKH